MEILPATSDLWPRLADLFAHRGGPDTRFCWCIFWRVRSKDFSEATPASNRERLRDLIDAGPPPGLVALEDGRAIGWVGLAPRPEYQRIERSRVIPRSTARCPGRSPASSCRATPAAGASRALSSRPASSTREPPAPRPSRATPSTRPRCPAGASATPGAYVGTRSMFERAGFHVAAETTSVSGGAPARS